MSITVNCARCGKPFQTTPSKLQAGRGKYCSRKCHFPPHYFTCQTCGTTFRAPPSCNPRYCSRDCANRAPEKASNMRDKAQAQWNDPATRSKLMEGIARRSDDPNWKGAAHFQRGELHPRYKGGNRKRLGEAGRHQYKLWRQHVLARDNYTCQKCGRRGGRLTAHHVKPWSGFPELRYDVANGMTLCLPCHQELHGLTQKHYNFYCCDCGAPHKDPRSKRCKSCGGKAAAAKRKAGL